MASALLSLLLFAFLALVNAQSQFFPTRPPSLPLAVSSPYLSIWQAAGSPQGNGPYLPGTWPTFWAGQIIGWAGLVRVDNRTYTWMGNPLVNSTDMPTLPTVVEQTGASYTPTRTIFNFNVAQKINMSVTFFSYHDGNDLKRQSFPFSYMNVDVASLDGEPHAVQVYTDITAEIISGDRNNTAEWTYGIYPNGTATSFRPRAAAGEPDAQPASQPLVVAKKEKRDGVGDIFQTFGTLVNYDGWMEAVQHVDRLLPLTPAYGNPSVASPPDGLPPQTNTLVATQAAAPASNNATGGIAYHQIFRQTQQAWSEVNDQTEFGYWYYVTDNVASLTHQSGEDGVLRLEFVNNGCLNQSADPNFRNISERYPAFAFSKDLGNVTSTTQSTLFGLGLAQQYPIQFEGASNYAPQEAMYTQYFASDLDAVSWFFSDYATALPLGVSLDEKIQADSVAAHGQNLATITTLAYRQVYGAYQVTGNTSSPLVWQKEISSNGNMNTADVMFPASPLFLYLSPSWLKSLMLPLYIQQEAGKWPYSFALHDIGSHYPNATGHPDGNAEQMPVEESGNMIILALAYAQKAQDTQFLTDHYAILRQWNQYLIGEALLPGQQLSTDDFASSLANQTNLALKGIIGIAAMGQIANLTGHAADATNFSGIATQYIAEWQTLGINANATPPHSVLDYNNATSHGLLYNLYADRLLATQLVPQSVYDIQSAFYPTVANRYGVPLDTRASYTKSDWESWAAAIASNSTADLLYGSIATFIKENPTNRPFTDLFDTITGEFPASPTFIARPVQGGTYAALALTA